MGKLIFVGLMLCMVACHKEPVKDCFSEIPALSIYGEWNAELINSQTTKGTLSFSAFGTFTSNPADLIIPNKFFGAFLSSQKFTIDSAGIRFSGITSDQKKQINSDYIFSSYKCNYIKLSSLDHADTQLILTR